MWDLLAYENAGLIRGIATSRGLAAIFGRYGDAPRIRLFNALTEGRAVPGFAHIEAYYNGCGGGFYIDLVMPHMKVLVVTLQNLSQRAIDFQSFAVARSDSTGLRTRSDDLSALSRAVPAARDLFRARLKPDEILLLPVALDLQRQKGSSYVSPDADSSPYLPDEELRSALTRGGLVHFEAMGDDRFTLPGAFVLEALERPGNAPGEEAQAPVWRFASNP